MNCKIAGEKQKHGLLFFAEKQGRWLFFQGPTLKHQGPTLEKMVVIPGCFLFTSCRTTRTHSYGNNNWDLKSFLIIGTVFIFFQGSDVILKRVSSQLLFP